MWLLLGVVQHRQAVFNDLQMCRSGRIPATGYTVGFGELVVVGLRLRLFVAAAGCCATPPSCVRTIANMPTDAHATTLFFFFGTFGFGELVVERLSLLPCSGCPGVLLAMESIL